LDCEEAFYGGAAGGGKSAALLAGALQYVDVAGYRAAILRRTYTQLSKGDALIPLSHEWLQGTDARWSEQKKTWTFPSGATIEFGHVKDENAKYDYQGAAYHYVAFDELTQFTRSVYEYIAFSRQRRRADMADLGIPVRVRSAANPGGIGHGWVRQRFISDRDPQVVYIPAKVRDNPGLDADDYEQRLRKLSPLLAQQLLDGNWDVFEGMAYPMFTDALHVVDAFDVPESWERFESLDPGTTNPASILAYAVDYDGNIVVFDELYVDEPVPHLPDLVVELLKQRRAWWHLEGASVVCHADPSAFAQGVHTKWGRQPSVVDEFAAAGVPLVKASNDRCAGYVRIGQLLAPDETHTFPDWHPRAGEPGSPRMFFVSRCTNLVEQIQVAPLEELGEPHPGEAVSRRWEGPFGHSHAALRYGVLAWPGPSEKPYEPLPDGRAEWLRKYADQVEKPKRSPRDYTL
jgi:Terminase large subunit, T4likevirus-type, N-terminal